MKVLLINGSSHENGNTFLALKECAGELERRGVETEIFCIGSGPVRGCLGCGGCGKTGECIYSDDVLPALVEKMKAADGIIVGSPVYYAGPNGALCALLDRAFYSAGGELKYKPAAAVAVARRGGSSAALDRLNKYFTINEMPLVSSQYWNMVYGCAPGEAAEDGEGLQTMRTLGKNMAHMLEKLSAPWPKLDEPRSRTNFVR